MTVAITLQRPGVDALGEVLDALREWQSDTAPFQLHPGDIGWFWRFGADATAAALRIWRRDGRIVAIGLLDGDDLLRLTMAPDAYRNEPLATQLARDITTTASGVLPASPAYLEAPTGVLVRDLLAESGWMIDAPWTPLARDLTSPVEDPEVAFEVIGPERAHVRVALQRAAFEKSRFTIESWNEMASGMAYEDARCLIAYGEQGDPVGAITVWSAGRGKPGLIEPMGVHRDYRGHGYGTAITIAGAQVLRQLGSSSAMVCTASSNAGAVATYRAAGFTALPERLDLVRHG
jgi:ribosomal protein S18 acetylase RimI-like enzyme